MMGRQWHQLDHIQIVCVRQHLSNDDSVEDKSEDYQNCSVLRCV